GATDGREGRTSRAPNNNLYRQPRSARGGTFLAYAQHWRQSLHTAMHRPRLGTTAHPSHLRNRQIVSRPRALINNVPGSIGPAASTDRAPLQQTDPEPSPHLPLTGPHRITL